MASFIQLFFIILSFQVLTSTQWAVDDRGCRTPGGGTGDCVIINDCKTITDYIIENQGLTLEQLTFLDDYKCGYSGRILKMCCPNEPLVVKKVKSNNNFELTSTTQSTTSLVRSIHRNANLLPFECGLSALLNKVVYGKSTNINEFPWMALLAYQSNNGPAFRCGGTIINERYILTAAHCINKQLISVRVGEYNISSNQDCETYKNNVTKCALPVQDIDIEKKIPHEKYISSLFQNDIALLRLSRPLDISAENIRAICLPTQKSSNDDEPLLTQLLLTGWGITEKGSTSDVLLKGEVPTANKEMCSKVYQRYNVEVSDNQFCFGGKGINKTDSCNGDSGGPLQTLNVFNDDVRFIQYGIVSLGPKVCGKKGIPTINTRVDRYIDWILDNIEP